MHSTAFTKLTGAALALAGLCFVVDTGLDALNPAVSPGIGALIPLFGLAGFPGFWRKLTRKNTSRLAILPYFLSMFGLTGLAFIAVLNNLIFPQLTPDVIGAVLRAAGPVFLATGSVFLLSAWTIFPLVWRQGDGPTRIGAVLYALGAIPVALPPLMPEALLVIGGVILGVALMIWGWWLLISGPDETA